MNVEQELKHINENNLDNRQSKDQMPFLILTMIFKMINFMMLSEMRLILSDIKIFKIFI